MFAVREACLQARSVPSFFLLLTVFYFLVPESLIKKSRFLVLKKLTMFGSLRRANRMAIEIVLSKFRSMPHCSTTGKPTRSFATERVSLDSV